MSMKYTDFNPTTNGFAFKNDFENAVTPVGVVPSFYTRGRCGGMAQAAADFFLAGLPIYPGLAPGAYPTEAPPDGDVIADYILRRQLDSFATIGPDMVAVAMVPGRADLWRARCAPGGHDFQAVAQRIDVKAPVPLALVPEGYDLTRLGKGHQVLAIGYDLVAGELAIYDPNHPGTTRVLRLNAATGQWLTAGARDSEAWYAWQPDLEYRFVRPDIYDSGVHDRTGQDLRGWSPPARQDLQGYTFRRANLSGARLVSCDLEGVDAQSAHLEGTALTGCDMRTMNLTGAYLMGANLTGSTLDGAILRGADASNCILNDTNLNQIEGTALRMVGATIGVKTFFQGAKLSMASFSRARLDGVRLFDIAAQGVSFDHSTIRETRFTGDLRMAVFAGATLANVSFRHVDLTGAMFTGAALSSVELVDITGWLNTMWAGAALEDCTFPNAAARDMVIRQGANVSRSHLAT